MYELVQRQFIKVYTIFGLCLSRVMVFICLLYIVFPFYILLIILYISLIYHFLKEKILTILNSYFNSDNQMRRIRDEQLYPIWGIFVSDLHTSILITLLLFYNFILHISVLYRYVRLCVQRFNKLVFIYIIKDLEYKKVIQLNQFIKSCKLGRKLQNQRLQRKYKKLQIWVFSMDFSIKYRNSRIF